MDETLTTALQSFATTVQSTISATDVLTVLGIAISAGLVIFIARWGAKLIVRKFTQAVNGHISG